MDVVANYADFDALGTSHRVMLAVFLLGIWPLVRLGRRHRGLPSAVRISRGYAVLIPCVLVPLQVIDFLPGRYSLQTTLPIQLCDLAWVAATVALWTQHRTAVALTYFWGLGLTTQGLLTPSLARDFPDPKFLAYWSLHILVIWAAIYLTWGLGLHPSWRDYRVTVALTAAWAVTVFVVNEALGTNYGFINRKPGTTTILDYLGPWPLYVLVEIALITGVWALMTWPWVRRDRAVPQPGREAASAGE